MPINYKNYCAHILYILENTFKCSILGIFIKYGNKNNYQNDRLTFKLSHKDDIWLHTKDIPGSHVVIDTKGDEIDEHNLLLAAQIAVHFSKARTSSKVPVDYVPIKFVKKPSGAKPGFVIFTNNKTLYVTPNEAEITPIIDNDLNRK